MKVIFLKDYQKTAKRGQLKQVADGLARNFLFPQKIAKMATPQAVLGLEQKMKEEATQQKKNQTEKESSAQKIKGQVFNIKRKAAKEKIFGSISREDICLELKKAGLEIAEEEIVLEQPIKKLGQHEIKVFPNEKITASFILKVEAE